MFTKKTVAMVLAATLFLGLIAVPSLAAGVVPAPAPVIEMLAKLSSKTIEEVQTIFEENSGRPGPVLEALGIDRGDFTALVRWAARRPDQEPPSDRRTRIVQVLAELSGKTPEEIVGILKEHKGDLRAALEALGLDPEDVRKLIGEPHGPKIPAMPRAIVRILSDLSGKTPEEVIETLKEHPGDLEEAVEVLGVSWGEFQQALKRFGGHKRHVPRGLVLKALSELTGLTEGEIVQLLQDHEGDFRGALEELGVTLEELKETLKEMRPPGGPGWDDRGGPPAESLDFPPSSSAL